MCPIAGSLRQVTIALQSLVLQAAWGGGQPTRISVALPLPAGVGGPQDCCAFRMALWWLSQGLELVRSKAGLWQCPRLAPRAGEATHPQGAARGHSSQLRVAERPWHLSSLAGDNLICGSYDSKLAWFDLDLSTKPYKVLR